MTLINTVAPENAKGEIKKGYDLFLERGIKVPNPFRLLSASPKMFDMLVTRNKYFSNHPNLSFELLAHIRYFVSKNLNYEFCCKHNKNLLLMQGACEDDFKKMDDDPEKSLLEENELFMLKFVLKAMDSPESISEKDINQLKESGWEDSDIFDALAQGVGMIDHNYFMKVFKPDF